MDKFGFTLSPSSRIDLDKADKEKFAEVVKLEPDILKCMACGSCTATCTVGRYTQTSIRRTILALQNGKTEQALNLLKGCLMCGKCTMVCPRAINTRNLVLAISKVYQNM